MARKRTQGGDHPELQNVVESLEEAKAELKEANRGLGGHRTRALKAVNNALKQLGKAMRRPQGDPPPRPPSRPRPIPGPTPHPRPSHKSPR
jgi:hypothetical protein